MPKRKNGLELQNLLKKPGKQERLTDFFQQGQKM
jgi:hypothetical protein